MKNPKRLHKDKDKEERSGTSVAVQWLGLGAPIKATWVQSVVGEIRSCVQRSLAKNNKKEERSDPRLNRLPDLGTLW